MMALAQQALGRGELPRMFSGHEPDGGPARSGRHQHLFFAAYASDGGRTIDRLAVVAPGLADRSVPGRGGWELLSRAVAGLHILRAGRDGVLRLAPLPEPDRDPAFGSGSVWVSLTPYRPTRHPPRGESPEQSLARDLLTECARRALPRPEIQLLEHEEGPRGGLSARFRLTFAVTVAGPLMLGRGSHFGAGLFRREP